uniref:MFS domain-containing protein n=1 Tax=Steinernema glaseri TaxID=37863 RepID=A0A1I8AT71_9BILA
MELSTLATSRSTNSCDLLPHKSALPEAATTSDCDHDEENEKAVDKTLGFTNLDKTQWATLVMLAVTTLADCISDACILPFFPTEAKKKGLSSSQVGLIIGAYQLVTMVFSPIMGRYMATIGPKKMYISGALVVGITTCLLGFMRRWPEGRPFFFIAMAIRCTMAIGDTAVITASLAIMAARFPGMLATLIGLSETIAGAGYASSFRSS